MFVTWGACARLRRTYDPLLLGADMAAVLSAVPLADHPANGRLARGWRGIALRSTDGSTADLLGAGSCRDTVALERAPYIRSVLEELDTPIGRARLLVLDPGGFIGWHYDEAASADLGVARLHLPIVTDEGIRFRLGPRRQRWRPGELWYGDFSFPHAVANPTPTARCHLVVDVEMGRATRALFPPGYLPRHRLRAVTRAVAQGTFRAARSAQIRWRATRERNGPVASSTNSS